MIFRAGRFIIMEISNQAPPGWSRIVKSGRVLYSSPPGPNSVKIYSKSMLGDFHKKGRFLEISENQLVFTTKRKPKQKNYQMDSKKTCLFPPSKGFAVNDQNLNYLMGNNVSGDDLEEMHMDIVTDLSPHTTETESGTNIDINEREKLEREKRKLEEAVKRLTINPEKRVDHKKVLHDTAKRLNELRLSDCREEVTANVNDLKEKLNNCKTEEEIVCQLWQDSWFQSRFSHLFSSKLLEQLLSMGLNDRNPLKTFPTDINTNLYADVVNFGIDYAKDVIMLITSLTRNKESPISTSDVVSVAFLLSSLAKAASRVNNAVTKTKSICLRSSGLTNSGLDSLSAVGVAVTSRSYRNDRDVMASISEEIEKQYAKKSVPQFTFDNMNIQINKVAHHLTLNILEFEQVDTTELSTEKKSLEQMLSFFSPKYTLLTSDENKDIFEHYKDVTAVALGQLFGREVKGMEWLLAALPKHHEHPNSNTSSKKSMIFIDKPLYYQETKNSDMMKIMDSLQLKYLRLVGEHVDDRKKYEELLKLIQSVECSEDTREDAEKEIMEKVLSVGELICHGDLLTYERFECCKRLRQGSVSALERYDFMPLFRLGMFHLRMNKTIMDLECGMPTEVNIEDDISLGYFRTTLGLNRITNKAENIKRVGEFERHDNFLLEIGKEILINAFETFMETFKNPIVKTKEGARNLILKFLKETDIKYYYDPENFDETDHFDDVLSACKNNASRSVMSLVADHVEHEGDGLGIRAVRMAMIFYFLNKKLAQTSKYASSLLSNLVYFLGASERSKARIDALATCNPTGGKGKGLARDQINEHKVKLVKETIRGLHSQITDTVLTKAVLGDNVLHQILEHDQESMLLQQQGGRTSYRYIGEEIRSKIKADIRRVKPFDTRRDKMDHFDKLPGSVFSGLTMDRVTKFLERNRRNFKRSYPHKKRD